MIRHLFLLFVFFSAFTVSGQTTILSDNFSGGILSSWTVFDGDGKTHDTILYYYQPGWFPYWEADEPDTCLVSTSYYLPAGQAQDYLITPKVTVPLFSKLVWSARSVDASYPDGYLVL